MKRNFKKRTSSTESITSIISNVLKNQNLEQPLNDKRIEEAWELTAGSAFVKYTTAVKSQRGVLYVSLSSSIVRNELLMAKTFIIKSLNKNLGSNIVKDVIFR